MRYVLKNTLWRYNKYFQTIEESIPLTYNIPQKKYKVPQGRGYALRITR